MTELERVLSIAPPASSEGLVSRWTGLLAAPGAPALRDKQAECLEALANRPHPYCGGFFGLDVGAGKTLVAMLAPKVMGVPPDRAVVLTLPSLVDQTRAEFRAWSRLYPCTPPKVVSYSTLSAKRGRDLLERLRPELLFCDEAHTLGNKDSARTKRFLRFAHANVGKTKFVFASGSFLKKSVKEVKHLLDVALLAGSPLPLSDTVAATWASVLDLDGEPTPQQLADLRPLVEWAGETGESQTAYRRAWRARLLSCPGVVWSSDGSCPHPLYLQPWKLHMTPQTEAAVRDLEALWELPDGTPLVSGAEVYRHGMSVPYGFYLDWDWDQVGGLDEEWNEARKRWAREVSAFLRYSQSVRLDSRAYVEDAANRRALPPRLLAAWDAWLAVADRPRPPSRVVVFDPEQVEVLRSAIHKLPETLVWTTTPQLGDLLDIPYHGQGSEGPLGGTALVSAEVHGTGWNGQHYCRNLFLQPESGAGRWQQVLGRTHRGGQTRPVLGQVAMFTDGQQKNVAKAKANAGKRQSLLGQDHKLLGGIWVPC